MDYLLTILLVAGNILGAGMILPQVLRLRGGNTTDGVSTVGVGVGIAQNLWWMIYGLQAEGAFGVVPVSVAGMVLYGTIACQIVRLDGWGRLSSILGGFAGIGVLPLVPYVLVDLQTAGVVIGLLYTVQFVPAAIAVMRTSVPSGVSASTWSMAWTEALIWFAYGLIIGDAALVIGGAGGSVLAGFILVRLLVPHSSNRQRLAV